jgi:ribosomal-protein-alanine N-acetyltransferase
MRQNFLKTDRLLLEPLQEQHADFLLDGLSEKALYTYIPQEPPEDNAHLKERFMRLARGTSPYGNERWLNWAVKEKYGQHYVGLIEATINSDEGAHLAYFIFSKFWQSGYATEACARAIEYLCTEAGCKSVRAEVDARNENSIKLLKKLGFQQIAFNENADVFKGASSNEYVYEYLPTSCRGDNAKIV